MNSQTSSTTHTLCSFISLFLHTQGWAPTCHLKDRRQVYLRTHLAQTKQDMPAVAQGSARGAESLNPAGRRPAPSAVLLPVLRSRRRSFLCTGTPSDMTCRVRGQHVHGPIGPGTPTPTPSPAGPHRPRLLSRCCGQAEAPECTDRQRPVLTRKTLCGQESELTIPQEPSITLSPLCGVLGGSWKYRGEHFVKYMLYP